VCANLCETVFVCTKFDDKNALVIEDDVNATQVLTRSINNENKRAKPCETSRFSFSEHSYFLIEGKMKLLATILVAFVALSHVGFLVIEMFMWDTPIGHRIFGLTPESAKITKTLALQQGLYNGFLAAGLIWGLIGKHLNVKIFFLVCVIIAGVFGAATVKPSIAFWQALPAALALAAVLVVRGK
jgi:putative membrane protein